MYDTPPLRGTSSVWDLSIRETLSFQERWREHDLRLENRPTVFVEPGVILAAFYSPFTSTSSSLSHDGYLYPCRDLLRNRRKRMQGTFQGFKGGNSPTGQRSMIYTRCQDADHHWLDSAEMSCLFMHTSKVCCAGGYSDDNRQETRIAVDAMKS